MEARVRLRRSGVRFFVMAKASRLHFALYNTTQVSCSHYKFCLPNIKSTFSTLRNYLETISTYCMFTSTRYNDQLRNENGSIFTKESH